MMPEPFWVRTPFTLWRWRPACYRCRRRFRDLGKWRQHYLSVHVVAAGVLKAYRAGGG